MAVPLLAMTVIAVAVLIGLSRLGARRRAARPLDAGAPPSRRRRVRRLPLAVAVLLLIVGTPRAALAHGDETEHANLLVLESISLISNGGGADAAAEKLHDALKAPDKKDMNLAKVKQALAIVEGSKPGAAGAADLARARALMTSAITVRAATGYGMVPEPGKMSTDTPLTASGNQPGTTVVLDELSPARGVSDGGDGVLIALAVLALAAGVYLSRRWRPGVTIRQLRRQSAEFKEA